jgi:CBS domain-containing protein
MRVSVAMRPVPGTLSPETGIGEALARLRGSPLHSWPVVDEKGFAGMIGMAELEGAAAEDRSSQPLAALFRDRAATPRLQPGAPAHVHPDHSLSLALERLGASHLDALPVVSRANVRELLGVVTLQDILAWFGVETSHGGPRGHD